MYRAFLVIASVIFSLTFSNIARAERTPAGVVIDGLHGALLTVMKDAETLGQEGRRAYLQPVIVGAFDFAAMARASVGDRWTALSLWQRARLVNTLGRLTVATYAARYDSFSGESFRTVNQESAPRKGIMVRTQLVRSNGVPLQLNYLLRESEDGWRIIDVLLQGAYSEVHMRRSQFNAVLRRDGFDGLIAAMEGQISDFENGGGG